MKIVMRKIDSDENGPHDAETAAFIALIQGRVQGVGFRYSCRLEARRLGLNGWVRNTGGGVEVQAEGSRKNLDLFLEWLRRGPPGARVDSVHCKTAVPAGYRNFAIET
ncbi:MAG: acylphosphatase [Treponema sp.]|jgi:acylphosphatase|nr:acylphosphatase [Treponema sp.]